jgi:hypothetical protein
MFLENPKAKREKRKEDQSEYASDDPVQSDAVFGHHT